MKARNDVFDNQQEDEQEEQSNNRIRKPPAYRDMDDAHYIKCIRRERYIGLAQGDKHSAVNFIRENEVYFKNAYSQDEKEIMHRAILWDNRIGLSQEDINLLRDVFGPLKQVEMKPSNTQVSERPNSYRPPSTPTEWMSELKFSTFVRFRKWMNNPSNKRYLDELDDYGLNCLCDTMEYQIHTNYTLPFQEKEGMNDDDMIWINQI